MMFKFKFNLKLAVPTSQPGDRAAVTPAPARADHWQAVTRDLPPVSVARRSGEGPGRRASQYLNQVKISESSHDSARAPGPGVTQRLARAAPGLTVYCQVGCHWPGRPPGPASDLGQSGGLDH
jgi:hypothetical protein